MCKHSTLFTCTHTQIDTRTNKQTLSCHTHTRYTHTHQVHTLLCHTHTNISSATQFEGDLNSGRVFCEPGSKPLQREELPNHERPREDPECPGLQGENTHAHTHTHCKLCSGCSDIYSPGCGVMMLEVGGAVGGYLVCTLNKHPLQF